MLKGNDRQKGFRVIFMVFCCFGGCNVVVKVTRVGLIHCTSQVTRHTSRIGSFLQYVVLPLPQLSRADAHRSLHDWRWRARKEIKSIPSLPNSLYQCTVRCSQHVTGLQQQRDTTASHWLLRLRRGAAVWHCNQHSNSRGEGGGGGGSDDK